MAENNPQDLCRCPECGSVHTHMDYDFGEDGEIFAGWLHCQDCGYNWTEDTASKETTP
jgi:transposase-like protein